MSILTIANPHHMYLMLPSMIYRQACNSSSSGVATDIACNLNEEKEEEEQPAEEDMSSGIRLSCSVMLVSLLVFTSVSTTF